MMTIFRKHPGEEAWLKRHEFCYNETEAKVPGGHLVGSWAYGLELGRVSFQ